MVSMVEFAKMVGISKRSAWRVVSGEAKAAHKEGRKNRLPLLSVLPGGQIRRLRKRDVLAWLDTLDSSS